MSDEGVADNVTPIRRRLDETRDAETIEKWKFLAHKTTTPDQLADFVRDLVERHEHSIESIVHAAAAAAVAACTVVMADRRVSHLKSYESQQAHNLVLWAFLEEFGGFDDGPKRIVQYRRMLYPQLRDSFRKTIDRNTMNWLIDQAKEALASGREMHSSVRFHLEGIAAGIPPFEYDVVDE